MQSSPGPGSTDTLVEPATAEEAVLTAMMSLGRRLRQRFADDQIDFSSLPLLKTLQCDGPLRLSVLATRLELDASTVSRHVRHLEDRGLLVRADDPEDRRASRVTVSERGKACLEEAAKTRRAMIASVLDHWTDDDREQLRVLLTRFQGDLSSSQSLREDS